MSRLLVQGNPVNQNASGMQVAQRGAGANMSVDIQIGDVIIPNTAGTFSYYAWQDAVSNLAISASNPSNPRIDAIVAYINTAVTSGTDNLSALVFSDVTGTPAGSPTAPNSSAIQTALGAGVPWVLLGYVAVAANATQVVTANITDQRTPWAVRANLWGGASNTSGHTVPNVADDTVQLLNAVQSPTNKTFSGATNKIRAGGANSSLVDSNSIQIDEEKQRTEHEFNYVASGCVWSGDSYGSTLNGSMTSGVVYIAGRRLTVATITAHVFTASKDTYIDFQDNGDGTAKVVYTEASNNTASPSSLSNSTTFTDATCIRNAIIITGGSSIVNAASVNQGQEDRVLPIASSIPYCFTDSIGNLICPRDPNRRVIGYRQIITDFTTTGSGTDITGLNLNCIVPTGRKIRVSGFIGQITASVANNGGSMALIDVTNSNTSLAASVGATNASSDAATAAPVRVYTPSTTTMNYKAQLSRGTNAATVHSNGTATNPVILMVELV